MFTMELSDFGRTADGAVAKYERTKFQAITGFAKGNALSKWLNCRDMIRSGEEFVIDECTEVDSVDVRRVGARDPGGQPQEAFPCGINVGPDAVRNYAGDVVPASVYAGERGRLTGGFTRGDEHTLLTDSRIEGVYVPQRFFADLTFATELSECGG